MESVGIQEEFEVIDNFLKELLPGKRVHSMDILKDVIKGNWVLEPQLFWEYIQEGITGYMDQWKTLFASLLALFILSAFVSSFMNAFHSEGTAKAARFLFLLSEIVLLVNALQEVISLTTEAMQRMLEFLKLVIPAYMLCVAATGSSLTAVIFYKLLIGFLCLIEGIVVAGIVPVVEGYMLLGIFESLFGEERFKLLMDTIKKGVLFVLKGLLVLMTGSGVLQMLITPVIDKTKMTIAQKTAAAIPGIGDIAESISGVTIASAVVVKNSLGIVILLILILCIAVPALRIFCILGTIKIGGAIGGICGETQMASCVEYMTDAGFLFLRLLVTVMSLFFIAIAALVNMTG